MCQHGAVGTGNGRNITACGQTVYVPPPSEDSGSNDIAKLLGIAVVAFGAYYLHTNYDFELKFDLTDNYQTYGTKKTFNLFEKNDNSLNFEMDLSHTIADDYYENRIFFGFTGTF
jgi:hypothetical protein